MQVHIVQGGTVRVPSRVRPLFCPVHSSAAGVAELCNLQHSDKTSNCSTDSSAVAQAHPAAATTEMLVHGLGNVNAHLKSLDLAKHGGTQLQCPPTIERCNVTSQSKLNALFGNERLPAPSTTLLVHAPINSEGERLLSAQLSHRWTAWPTALLLMAIFRGLRAPLLQPKSFFGSAAISAGWAAVSGNTVSVAGAQVAQNLDAMADVTEPKDALMLLRWANGQLRPILGKLESVRTEIQQPTAVPGLVDEIEVAQSLMSKLSALLQLPGEHSCKAPHVAHASNRFYIHMRKQDKACADAHAKTVQM